MNISTAAGTMVPYEMVVPSPREIAARTAPPPQQPSAGAASAGVVVNSGKIDVMA